MPLRLTVVTMLMTLFLGLGLGLGFSSNAQNSKNDKNDNVDTVVLSDTMVYNDANKSSVFNGNVILTRGTMRIDADIIKMNQAADGTQQAQASMQKKDARISLRSERPEQYETIIAKSQQANYDGAKNTVILTHNAVVTRYVCGVAVDTITGDKILYNNNDQSYEATSKNSGTAGQRVRVVSSSQNKNQAAFANCQKTYKNKPMPSSLDLPK